MSQIFITTTVLSVIIRILLFNSEMKADIGSRVELTTPANSVQRTIEDLHRMELLPSPPTYLNIYYQQLLGFNVPVMYIVMDLLTAVLLYNFAQNYMLQLFIRQEKEKHAYAENGGLLKDFTSPPVYVYVVYLLNPFTILNCIAMTTTSLHNLFVALFLSTLQHSFLPAIALAASILQSFYTVTLSIHLNKKSLLLVLLILIVCGFNLEHWSFIWTVPDQKPNIGIFWYLFTEMFEHFSKFFLVALQINATVLYFIPFAITFRHDKHFLIFVNLLAVAIFKSYPALGDFALIMGLLPCWMHLYPFLSNSFVIFTGIIIGSVLMPVVWDLWVVWGVANANFFFGGTLAFLGSMVGLLCNLTFAFVKREYCLKYGNEEEAKGKVLMWESL